MKNNLTQQKLTEFRLENLRNVPRCGAKTRRQTACISPRVRGNKRCRMHGGKGSGAPKGSQNALKHGLYTAETLASQRSVRDLIKRCKKVLDQAEIY